MVYCKLDKQVITSSFNTCHHSFIALYKKIQKLQPRLQLHLLNHFEALNTTEELKPIKHPIQKYSRRMLVKNLSNYKTVPLSSVWSYKFPYFLNMFQHTYTKVTTNPKNNCIYKIVDKNIFNSTRWYTKIDWSRWWGSQSVWSFVDSVFCS